MKTYYTEYPTGEFVAVSDAEARRRGRNALIIYRESDTPDGTPFIIVKGPDLINKDSEDV